MNTGNLSQERPFAGLWEATRARLEPLGLTECPLEADLAAREGRMRLVAARWLVGPAGNPVAECRAVRILGAAAEIFNVCVFPEDPGRLPVFVAELLAAGGRPRVVFLDLQVPGLSPGRLPAVAAWACAVAERHANLPGRLEPPDWAARHSTGGYLFCRARDGDHAGELRQAFVGYLDAWAGLAEKLCPGEADPAAGAALAAFKHDHLAHYPGRGFLDKQFGPEWTERFLTAFLYR